MEEKRKAEAFAVSRYNKLIDAYATIVEDSTDSPSEEDLQASYSVCLGAFDTLSQQREADQATFQTICDNYCVNKQGILLSSENPLQQLVHRRLLYPQTVCIHILSDCQHSIRYPVYFSKAERNPFFSHLSRLPTRDSYVSTSSRHKQTTQQEGSHLPSYQTRAHRKRRKQPTHQFYPLLL